jgi:hypothetical protein
MDATQFAALKSQLDRIEARPQPTAPSPESALATLCNCIGTDRWPGLLDLMKVLLARDGKRVVDEMMTVKDFAARTKCSTDTAYKAFANYPTVKIMGCRRMTETAFQKHFLNREA